MRYLFFNLKTLSPNFQSKRFHTMQACKKRKRVWVCGGSMYVCFSRRWRNLVVNAKRSSTTKQTYQLILVFFTCHIHMLCVIPYKPNKLDKNHPSVGHRHAHQRMQQLIWKSSFFYISWAQVLGHVNHWHESRLVVDCFAIDFKTKVY